VAIFSAIAAGARRIEAIALACPDTNGDAAIGALMPCGTCRQVMAEFAGPDLPVYVSGAGTFALGELLPNPFGLGQASNARTR
jgi:cytidine deaminase